MHDHLKNLPTRRQALVFFGKVKVLQTLRLFKDMGKGVKKYPPGESLSKAPVRGESSTPLWSEEHPAERELTAGKIQNLRVACRALNGVVVPAGEVFSFWKQTGRTSRRKGYVVGRELREGCLIPSLGGGLCQLSNGLYNAALKAGFKVVERHAHSQQVPGSLAAVGRDATVFWNYVDLRFSHSADFRIEASLSKNLLRVSLRSEEKRREITTEATPNDGAAVPIGNCYSCNVGGCFRNAPQGEDAFDPGRTAVMLDAYTPEFQTWMRGYLKADAEVHCPIDARRFRAPAYRWENVTATPFKYATLLALTRALRLRFLPGEGGALQRTLMGFDKKLAAYYARRIDYRATHLIVSQNLLPHLWELGAMGGRTYEVLANRYPLGEIQARLDRAHRRHSRSTTLNDFRVDEELCRAEQEALERAHRIHTPHHGVAAAMPGDVNILPWEMPPVEKRERQANRPLRIGFPASPLGKKGVYELTEALEGIRAEVLVFGKAEEGVTLPNSRAAALAELEQCDVVVLPAYVEHSPRPLLRALAAGVPVIATKACGLPAQDGLTLIDKPDATRLRQEILAVLKWPEDRDEEAGEKP